jgi:hypothetical protein
MSFDNGGVGQKWVTAGDVIDGMRGIRPLAVEGGSLLDAGQKFAENPGLGQMVMHNTSAHAQITRRNLYVSNTVHMPGSGQWEEITDSPQQQPVSPPRFSGVPRVALPQQFEVDEYIAV